MKAFKFMLIAALVSTAAIFSACSKSADDHYKKIQELAAKETLSPDDVDEAVDVTIKFIGALSDEGMVVVENAKDRNEVVKWFFGNGNKYPDWVKLIRKVEMSGVTDEQYDKLKKADREYVERIDKAINERNLR